MKRTSQSLVLGLIGGLGVGATIHYYRELVKSHEEAGQTCRLLIAHAEMRSVFDQVESNRPDRLAQYLAGFLDTLKAGGANVAAISAVTPHLCFQELAAISPLPLLSIVDAIAQKLIERCIHRVAIFGTASTIETSLFGQLRNVEVVVPTAGEINYIHKTYVHVASKGSGSDTAFHGLTALAQALCQREQLDAILLAGTDFSLLFNEGNTDFPHIDCAGSHIRMITSNLLTNTADQGS